jgi:hypothetical protein
MGKKWTNEETDLLKQVGKDFLTKEIQKLLPHRSLGSILTQCCKLKIKKTLACKVRQGQLAETFVDRTKYHKLDHSLKFDDLSNEVKQVLIGSILGDGCIKRGGNAIHFIFSESHGFKQRDYVLWKKDRFEIFKPNYFESNALVERKGEKIWVKKPTIITPSHPIFTELRTKFYSGKSKDKDTIPYELIEQLDSLGLLIWYLDDGTRNDCSPIISNKGFGYEQLCQIVCILNKNLKCSLYAMNNKGSNRICFNPENRDRFLDEWQNINIPESMKYKLIIKEKITREYVRKIKDEDIPIIIGMSQNGLPTRIIATHFGVSEELSGVFLLEITYQEDVNLYYFLSQFPLMQNEAIWVCM